MVYTVVSGHTSCRPKPEAACRLPRSPGRQAVDGDNLTTRGEEPVFHGGLSRSLARAEVRRTGGMSHGCSSLFPLPSCRAEVVKEGRELTIANVRANAGCKTERKVAVKETRGSQPSRDLAATRLAYVRLALGREKREREIRQEAERARKKFAKEETRRKERRESWTWIATYYTFTGKWIYCERLQPTACTDRKVQREIHCRLGTIKRPVSFRCRFSRLIHRGERCLDVVTGIV